MQGRTLTVSLFILACLHTIHAYTRVGNSYVFTSTDLENQKTQTINTDRDKTYYVYAAYKHDAESTTYFKNLYVRDSKSEISLDKSDQDPESNELSPIEIQKGSDITFTNKNTAGSTRFVIVVTHNKFNAAYNSLQLNANSKINGGVIGGTLVLIPEQAIQLYNFDIGKLSLLEGFSAPETDSDYKIFSLTSVEWAKNSYLTVEGPLLCFQNLGEVHVDVKHLGNGAVDGKFTPGAVISVALGNYASRNTAYSSQYPLIERKSLTYSFSSKSDGTVRAAGYASSPVAFTLEGDSGSSSKKYTGSFEVHDDFRDKAMKSVKVDISGTPPVFFEITSGSHTQVLATSLLLLILHRVF